MSSVKRQIGEVVITFQPPRKWTELGSQTGLVVFTTPPTSTIIACGLCFSLPRLSGFPAMSSLIKNLSHMAVTNINFVPQSSPSSLVKKRRKKLQIHTSHFCSSASKISFKWRQLAKCAIACSIVILYIIIPVILALWLVLAYDLLEDRRIDDDSARFNFFQIFEFWIWTNHNSLLSIATNQFASFYIDIRSRQCYFRVCQRSEIWNKKAFFSVYFNSLS